MATEPHTITLTRTLSSAQFKRRHDLVVAARALATEGGYAAVTMHDVSVRAGVGRATVYRYFSSKDHLLAAVSSQWVEELTIAFAAKPPRHAKAADRVAAILDRVINHAVDDMQLTAAVMQASVNCDPAVWDSEPGIGRMMHDYLEGPIGDELPPAVRRDVEMVLGHVMFSALVNLSSGRRTEREVREVLRRSARTVVR